MLGDERTDQRCRGSLSRAKKVAAALSISTVCSNPATLRFNSRFSRVVAVVTPVTLTAIDLGLPDPLAQRLRADTDPNRDRPNTAVLTVVLVTVVHRTLNSEEPLIVLLSHASRGAVSKDSLDPLQ